MNQPAAYPVDLAKFSGKGLLDFRALWASVVGPSRLAMARTSPFTLQRARSIKVASNIGAADAYMFIGVALPTNAPTNPLTVIFSKNPDAGSNAGVPVQLVDSMGRDGQGFMQLLLPGEEMFAQITAPAPAPAAQRVIVAQVIF